MVDTDRAAASGSSSPIDLGRLFRGIGLLVPPAALAFYFGWARTNALFLYFGIDSSTLGLSTQDYLLRSADPLLFLLALASIIGLLASTVPLPSAVSRWTSGADTGRRRLRLALGGILLFLAAFWIASRSAQALGRGRAQDLVSEGFSRMPKVTVYSKQRLVIDAVDAPGVHETMVSDPEAAYRFKYTGFRLLIQSGGKYFLLPQEWSTSSVAIVLPDGDALRLEFTPGRRQ